MGEWAEEGRDGTANTDGETRLREVYLPGVGWCSTGDGAPLLACCDSHYGGWLWGGCCDPNDCGPCCALCPTCPTVNKRPLQLLSSPRAVPYWFLDSSFQEVYHTTEVSSDPEALELMFSAKGLAFDMTYCMRVYDHGETKIILRQKREGDELVDW